MWKMYLDNLTFTLNFKGGSQCYSCLTGLFKTVPLNSS